MLHDDSLSNAKVDDPWGKVVISLGDLIKSQGDYPTYANTLNAFAKTAAAVSIMKLAQHHSYSLFTKKASERMNLMQETTDIEYDTDWRHAMKKARVLMLLARLRCWPIIWAASRLR